MTFAKTAYVNNATGARLEGEFIADTGPTWLVKPEGKPVQSLSKDEWTSAAPAAPGNPYADFDFNKLFGGAR